MVFSISCLPPLYARIAAEIVSAVRFPEQTPPSIFPNLKEFKLRSVNLSNDLFRILLLNCRFLETLHLIYTFTGSDVVSVRAPRLRELVWRSAPKELTIEDAPNLESLMFNESTTMFSKVKIVHVPKLELLSLLHVEFDVLQLGETYFQRQQIGPTVTFDAKATPYGVKALCSVKTLAIKMGSSDKLDGIMPSLFRFFPCLEHLDVLNHDNGYDGYRISWVFWNGQEHFSFLDHLKTVTVKGFYDVQSEVEFLRFLVVNGKVLKKITLLCYKYSSKKFIETKRRHVCMDKRASSDLELVFVRDSFGSDRFAPWNDLIEDPD